MILRLDGHEFDNKQLSEEVVNLSVENFILKLQFSALSGMLMSKGIITEDELKSCYSVGLDILVKELKSQGKETEILEVAVKDRLNL